MTAKCSCDTRLARRVSGSRRRRSASASAATAIASTTATETRSTTFVRMPHNAKLPSPFPGPIQPLVAARICATATIAPSAVAAQRGTRNVCVSTAVTTNSRPISAPVAAPLAAHAGADPGSRRDASSPAMPPTIRPAKARARQRCTTGVSSTARRGTGAGIRWRTSPASSEIGPPSLPLRRPRANAATANSPMTAGPRSSTSASCAAVAGSSLTRPLSQAMARPPARAVRYTR